MTTFQRLSEVLDEISVTRSKNKKIKILSGFLQALETSELEIACSYLAGRVFPESSTRKLNLSWKGVMDALGRVIQFSQSDFDKRYSGDFGTTIEDLLGSDEYTKQTSLFREELTVISINSTFDKISELSGSGSKRQKEDLMVQLFQDASPREAKYIVSLISGDMRTGVLDGLLAEAIASAFEINPSLVRRVWSFTGNLGVVARIAKLEGERGLNKLRIEYFHPVKPMLATPAESLAQIIDNEHEFAFETKFDGARIQIHKQGYDIRLYSRRLEEVTDSLPEVIEVINHRINANGIILDAEVIAVADNGKPYPFQVIMRRYGRTDQQDSEIKDIKIDLVVFDILKHNGQDTIDLEYNKRREKLEEIVDSSCLIQATYPHDLSEAEMFFERTKLEGHEGIIAKKIDSPYRPGNRGKMWYKLKHTLDTLDLVIIAAEWGYGRRSAWLSDYHLAVRDHETGKYWEIGKTFKGLTDKEFEIMTARLLELETRRERGIVFVKPEVVVEVLADEIQDSPTYESRMALRFARIIGIREDKNVEDATSLKTLRAIFEAQFKYKARY